MNSDFPVRPVRIDLATEARLIDEAGAHHAVVLLNVSQSGFSFTTSEVFVPGERLVLRSGRSPDARIEIRWHRGREAGGIFLDQPAPVERKA